MKKSILIVFVVVLILIFGILFFDYFSSSFNLIFLADKSLEVAIYGSPSIGEGISFK